jgi:hypothetical protein
MSGETNADETTPYITMANLPAEEFGRFKERLRIQAQRAVDGSIDVDGACPNCGFAVHATASPPIIVFRGSLFKALTGQGEPGAQRSAEQAEAITGERGSVPVQITCQCMHNHPGRPPGTSCGCGFSFEVTVTPK